MDIKPIIRLNKIIENDPNAIYTEKTIASGWVEIDGFIKFPVNVRRYVDKEDGKEKLFVSYPQRRKADGTYEDVVRPESREIRKMVQEAVVRNVYDELAKGLNTPEISGVRVTPVQERSYGNIKVKALASVTVSGFVINGLQVKEGNRGLFVQMPQYNENGEYKDMVYGMNSFVQNAMKEAVLVKYKEAAPNSPNKKIKEEQDTDLKDVQIPITGRMPGGPKL